MVYRTCYRYVRDPEDAQDLAQDVFVKLHSRLPGFRGDAALTTWIYRIAVNACIDFLRSRREFVEYGAEGVELPSPGQAGGPGDASLAKVDLGRLLGQSDARTREILFLSLAEGCSYQEVAEVVGLTRWAVAKVVVRFQARMKEGKKAWFRELFAKEAR
jgi:RNA polymerase sigma-70 factor (ECF subfamily)